MKSLWRIPLLCIALLLAASSTQQAAVSKTIAEAPKLEKRVPPSALHGNDLGGMLGRAVFHTRCATEACFIRTPIRAQDAVVDGFSKLGSWLTKQKKSFVREATRPSPAKEKWRERQRSRASSARSSSRHSSAEVSESPVHGVVDTAESKVPSDALARGSHSLNGHIDISGHSGNDRVTVELVPDARLGSTPQSARAPSIGTGKQHVVDSSSKTPVNQGLFHHSPPSSISSSGRAPPSSPHEPSLELYSSPETSPPTTEYFEQITPKQGLKAAGSKSASGQPKSIEVPPKNIITPRPPSGNSIRPTAEISSEAPTSEQIGAQSLTSTSEIRHHVDENGNLYLHHEDIAPEFVKQKKQKTLTGRIKSMLSISKKKPAVQTYRDTDGHIYIAPADIDAASFMGVSPTPSKPALTRSTSVHLPNGYGSHYPGEASTSSGGPKPALQRSKSSGGILRMGPSPKKSYDSRGVHFA